MKKYIDELLAHLESEHPDLFTELHGWSARREWRDMELQMARQNRFIFRHMPRIMARLDEHLVVSRTTTSSYHEQVKIPVFVVEEIRIIHCWKEEEKP